MSGVLRGPWGGPGGAARRHAQPCASTVVPGGMFLAVWTQVRSSQCLRGDLPVDARSTRVTRVLAPLRIFFSFESEEVGGLIPEGTEKGLQVAEDGEATPLRSWACTFLVPQMPPGEKSRLPSRKIGPRGFLFAGEKRGLSSIWDSRGLCLGASGGEEPSRPRPRT